MIDAIGGEIEAGRVKVYAVDSFDSGSWYREGLSLEERAQQHGRYEDWILNQVVPFIQADSDTAEIMVTGVSFGAYHAANFALRHAHVFPLAICQSGVYDVSVVAGGERGDTVYFNNPGDYVAPSRRRPPRLAARPGQPPPDRRPGPVGGHDRRAREHAALRASARREGDPARARPLGARLAARLARVARPDRASSPSLPMSDRTHLIGLLLGTEEDWPRAFEHLLAQVGPIEHEGTRHELTCERITNEPFDLRYRPRYALVIDRLGWWYTVPREWLKKVSLMDDVYLLNNPFTFQAMEKHSAYCAMMRLGLNVPETWLIPHKSPPANERFQPTAERYNLPFDLEEIAARIGFPLYMKPFDGGQWVGVTRIRDPHELHAVYDTLRRAADAPAGLGRGLRRLRAQPLDRRRDDGDALRARPADVRPLPGRPRLPLGRAGRRGRDDQPARERLLPLGVQLVRDDRQGRRRVPDRLRERLPGRRADEPALLLPVGDPGARPLVGVLLGDRAADADQPVDARLLRGRRPRRPRLRGEARGVPAARRRLLPGRPSTRSSAPRSCRTWTSSSSTGSRAPGFDRPARRHGHVDLPASTSTSTSSGTTAACSPPGRRISAPQRERVRPRADAGRPDPDRGSVHLLLRRAQPRADHAAVAPLPDRRGAGRARGRRAAPLPAQPLRDPDPLAHGDRRVATRRAASSTSSGAAPSCSGSTRTG